MLVFGGGVLVGSVDVGGGGGGDGVVVGGGSSVVVGIGVVSMLLVCGGGSDVVDVTGGGGSLEVTGGGSELEVVDDVVLVELGVWDVVGVVGSVLVVDGMWLVVGVTTGLEVWTVVSALSACASRRSRARSEACFSTVSVRVTYLSGWTLCAVRSSVPVQDRARSTNCC